MNRFNRMTTQFELKTRYLLTEIKHRRPLQKFHPLYLKEQQRITNKRKLIPNSKKQKTITIRWKKGMKECTELEIDRNGMKTTL